MTQAITELVEALAAEIDAGNLFEAGKNLFSVRLPDDQDECTLIQLTGGRSDHEAPIEEWSLQILSRGNRKDPDGPLDLARRLHQHMDNGWRLALGLQTEIITANWRFMMFRTVGTPAYITMDEKHRPLVSANVIVNVAPVV